MDGRQTLEAIFTSSANSDRLPPPAPSGISAALSHERTSLFPRFHPSQTIGCHCSSKYPNNMLFFSKLGCISELSMMGLKMTSNGPFDFGYTESPATCFAMKGVENASRSKKKKNSKWSLVSAGGRRRKTSSEFRVLVLPVVCRPSRTQEKKEKLFAKNEMKQDWVESSQRAKKCRKQPWRMPRNPSLSAGGLRVPSAPLNTQCEWSLHWRFGILI